ncbi:hypothetical protein GCM10007161_17900 [Ignatzschineria indica]|uniref:RidA family protein n=1 Tax=Ignatzschineria indica TaxID=472583 RepID=A0A2U2AJB9_9GAMM|nr:RidA family protein [Ignatzschineria indica]PWD82737.1 hypothetical protein DC082_09005 [Ignatzschineria indica]GGZ86436.1 hypothetical protein GCM10007161_17900 [Ignatzschineria indica]
MKKLTAILLAAGITMGGAMADDIVRTAAPGGFPISTVVEVPSDVTTYYLSGAVPPKLEDGTFARTTEEQTVGILNSIKKTLEEQGLTMGDIVKMQVYLVADPDLGKMDFAGFMKGYAQFFGEGAETKVPARSAFEVKGLAFPEWLIEIEVIAAKKK